MNQTLAFAKRIAFTPGALLVQGAYTTFAGAACFAAVLLVFEALIACAKLPYDFAGSSVVLVVVCAVLVIEAQVRDRSLARRGGNSS